MTGEEYVMSALAGIGAGTIIIGTVAVLGFVADRLIWRPRDERDDARREVAMLQHRIELMQKRTS